MKRRWLVDLFLEYLIASLAEGTVAAVGWTIRKLRKWWRKRKREDDPQSAP